MNLIMKRTAVIEAFFLIMPIFMTKKKYVVMEILVSKVAIHKALLKCKAKIGNMFSVKRNFLIYFLKH